MKIPESAKILFRQKSTWAGIAAIVIALAGLDSASAEQFAVILAGVFGVLYPEKVEPK